MKILLVSLDSSIQQAFATKLNERGRDYAVLSMDQLASDESINIALNNVTDAIVVNALGLEVAINAVGDEQAQQYIDTSLFVAEACSVQHFPLIHLSSSLVFDGLTEGPYAEGDEIVPVSLQANLVMRMEELVNGALNQIIILRTTPLISTMGRNPLIDLLTAFEQGEKRVLSTTSRGAPTYVDDLMRVLSAIIDQVGCGAEVWGTYHYCSSDISSEYEFGETLLAIASQYIDVDSLDVLIEETEADKEEWQWPILNCTKLLYTFGVKQLPWRAFITSEIKSYFERLKEDRIKEN